MLIYEILKNDHDRIKDLLNALITLDEDAGQQRYDLIREIRDELIPHARAEESIFYNSLRSADKSSRDEVIEAFKEHMQAEVLLRTLQMKDKIDLDWRKTAKNLKEVLDHHIKEEENKIFPLAQQVFTDEEARMMGEAFQKMKPEIQKEGFMKTTIDMIANLMPRRFVDSVKSRF